MLSFQVISVVFYLLAFRVRCFVVDRAAVGATTVLVGVTFRKGAGLVKALPFRGTRGVTGAPEAPEKVPVDGSFVPCVELSEQVVQLGSFFIVPVSLDSTGSLLLGYVLIRVILGVFMDPVDRVAPVGPWAGVPAVDVATLGYLAVSS